MPAKTEEQKKIDARLKNETKAVELNIVFTPATSDEDLEAAIKNQLEINKKKQPEVEKKKIILKNVSGKDIDPTDYFYSKKKGEDTSPDTFNKVSGYPVEREEMLEVFNRIFKPEKGLLFYKQYDKEVYVIIVPLKYATSVGAHNDSIDGDHQRHAISFIGEGSVNMDTLRQKLTKVAATIDLSDK